MRTLTQRDDGVGGHRPSRVYISASPGNSTHFSEKYFSKVKREVFLRPVADGLTSGPSYNTSAVGGSCQVSPVLERLESWREEGF